MDEQHLAVFMELICYSGDGKSSAHEAIQLAKSGDISGARAKMKEASDALLKAHHVQTDMLTEEARGNHILISLLTVHSQDHLMTAMTFMDLAQELIDVHELMQRKE